jgi:hypothetical protein
MTRTKYVLAFALLQVSVIAVAEDQTGRIKKKPPSPIEAQRIISDMAMNDDLLRKGDIIATDRGFFVFRGLARDGITNEFESIPNPVRPAKK